MKKYNFNVRLLDSSPHFLDFVVCFTNELNIIPRISFWRYESTCAIRVNRLWDYWHYRIGVTWLFLYSFTFGISIAKKPKP
jgi:hypothetical protein